MGRTSVERRADEIRASQLYHIVSQKDRLFAVLFGGMTFVPWCASGAVNVAAYCEQEIALGVESVDDTPFESSWVFRRSTFTNDPLTGARVAQYERKPPIEPLDDQRNVTSSYRRTRTSMRGLDGSYDDAYQVQAWGNGRGGLDAEWERFHDAWKESILSGSYFHGPAYGPYGFGGVGYGNGGWGWNGLGPNQGGWAPGSGGGQVGPPNGGGRQGGSGPYNWPSNDDRPLNHPNQQWQND